MSTLTKINSGRTSTIPRVKRSIADLLSPLDLLAQTSPSLIAKPAGRFEIDEQAHELILAEYQKLMAYAPNL